MFVSKELGKVRMLFSADIFGVERSEVSGGRQAATGTTQGATTEQALSATLKGAVSGPGVMAEAQGYESVGQGVSRVPGEAEVLIYTDNDGEAGNMAAFLADMGFRVKIFHFKDSSKNNLLGEVRCIFLVMKEVGEQGFGVAIRINSLVPTVSLVAAGPAWTKTTVFKGGEIRSRRYHHNSCHSNRYPQRNRT